MSLAKIQFDTALRDATIEVLKRGKVPSLTALTKEITKRLPIEKTSPSYRLRRQRTKTAWDLLGMNNGLREIGFDLAVMYSAYLDLTARTLRRLNLVDASSKAQHAQMDRIEAEARNLLFLIQNGDGYSFGFFDDFHDLSKIEPNMTTVDAIDLKSQVAELPDASPSTRRVSMDHMRRVSQWPVEIQPANVLTAATPADAPFSNMFSDTLSMWRHDVVMGVNGPVSATFVVPIHAISGGEISLTRVQLVGASEFPQAAEVFFSTDGQNWLRFPGAESLVDLDRSTRTVNIDFESTRVEFIKIVLYRQSHDKVVSNGYLTSFGLQSLAFYAMGRAQESIVVSKVHEVPAGRRLEKVSFSVFEETPRGTDIRYFVGPVLENVATEEQKENEGTWLEITPVGRPIRKDEAPRVITMSTLSRKTLKLAPATPITVFENYKGIDFFQLNVDTDAYSGRLVTEDILFGSAVLMRGKNAWLRSNLSDAADFRVSNAYISFASGPKQKLYAVATEIVDVGPTLPWAGSDRTTLQVSRAIDFRSEDGMSLIPPAEVDPYKVGEPLHAVYEVSMAAETVEDTENVIFHGTGREELTKGPIDFVEQQVETEYLCAFVPVPVGAGTDPTVYNDLIEEMEGRPSLAAQYAQKTVKNIQVLTSDAEVEAGKPRLYRITIGNHDSASPLVETTFDAEIVSTSPVSQDEKDPTTYTDEELLRAFGRVRVRSVLLSGITGTKAGGTVTYLPGVDFVLTIIPDANTGVPKTYVQRSTGSRIGAADTVTFKFRYKKNLTRNVMMVSGNRIYLDKELSIPTGTRLRIGYRFVPTATNEVLPDTLKVLKTPNGTEAFTAGRDYIFNPADGSITLVSTGGIPSAGGHDSVYASFSYAGAANDLQQFSAWVFIPSRDPVRIHHAGLTVDVAYGERVSISNGAGGYFDLSSSTETPDLTYGWHQVLITSRNPDVYQGSAIQKTIDLKDINDNTIFLAGGLYFSEVRATRVSMTQVDYAFLKSGVVPSDRTKFAIDEDGHVLVNFQPNSQQEIYTYGYRTDDTGDEEKDFWDEEFTLEYDYHRDEARSVVGLRVRAVLSRENGTDAGVTPKLHGYQVRASG